MDFETIPSNPSEFPINTITQLLVEKAERNGDEPLLIEEATGDSITYEQALERADVIGASLHERGIEKGDIVVTILPNILEHVLVWFGCMRTGAIWSPVNPSFKSDELAHAIETVDPAAVVVDDEAYDTYDSLNLSHLDVENQFAIDVPESDLEDFEVLLEDIGAMPEVDIAPSDPALLCFTGGTTGMPKAVLHSQFAPLTGAYRYKNIYETTPDDRHMTLLKLFHVGGQQFGILGPMLSDMSTVLVRDFTASGFFDQVNRYEATITAPVGSVLGILVNTYDEPVENSLRWIASGWQVRDIARRARQLFDVELMGGYALTEGGGIKLTNVPFTESEKLDLSEEGEPVGKIGGWGEIEILNESGETLPPNTVGEICLRPTIPHSMMECYYNDPRTTVETWDGLWIHTGDLGRLDEDGMLYFVGRQSGFMRVKGENVSAVEVETVIGEHPDIDEAAVVGLPNTEIGGEDIKAYVVSEKGVDPEKLIEWSGQRLSEFKLPRYVEEVDTLPRSDTKKNVRRDILEDRGVGDAWEADRR